MGIKNAGEGRAEKEKGSIVSRSRVKLWIIMATSSLLLWTCLVQLTALGGTWGPRLLKGVYANNGYLMVSCNGGLNQMRAVEGEDVVAWAKTGSGKTFAYVLPLLHKLFSDSGSKNKLAPAAFVLVSTRELCQQYRVPVFLSL
ncbi:hypothetical protein Vadar_020834 [Vaccinium darrowii]|uniref:Uncharacterized protein n=1 Tax=Vaccinium darrowii TaxID=229202 RepID=A0ACB7YNS8_9ERIC|nr:hypothetical protein Vadar_020834 [Vaccinium darrowii]